MPTNRRRRLFERRPEGLLPIERAVLEGGSAGAIAEGFDPIESIRIRRQHAERLWGEWRDLILADWRDQRRPGRPWAAMKFEQQTTTEEE